MQEWMAWLEQATNISAEEQINILTTLLTVILLWLLHRLVKSFIRRIEDPRTRYSLQKASGYVLLLVGFLLVIQIWFGDLRNAATYLGLLSAGLAIALRDLIIGFIGWVFILVSRPFKLGDRIQIGGVSGDVIDLRIFQFTLMEIGNWVEADQITGRIVHIPNGRVFTDTVANYDAGFHYIWNEIPVLLKPDSNWQKARDLLLKIVNQNSEHMSELAEKQVREASQRFMIYETDLSPIVYTSVKERGVQLTIRYLCAPRQRRASADAIWAAILEEFGKHEDIQVTHL